MADARAAWIWAVVAVAVVVPMAIAAASPLLAWRDPVYIAAGFAGILAMVLLLFQPLLAAGYLTGLPARRERQVHRVIGAILVLAVLLHVAGLWVTSPPDVMDALLFASPTSFSIWGVIAMWAIFATALLVTFRRRLPMKGRTWRRCHSGLALVIVLGSVSHAMLIDGTMGTVSKAALCALVVAGTIKALIDLKVFARRTILR